MIGGGAAAALAGSAPRGTFGTVDGQTPRLQWIPLSPDPQITWSGSTEAERELLHPTMLPLRQLTGDPGHPAWALFAWHHDSQPDQHLHRWSAPSPAGPWTHLGPAPVPVLAPPFQPNHLSSGDIVWDRANRRLISNPHGAAATRSGNGEPDQSSFLLESRDGGASWDWLDGDPRIRLDVGPVGSPDSVHTGYGRLLRDLDGELVRHADRHWWIYRAQRKDAGQETAQTVYTPWLASSPTISGTWTKEPAAAFLPPTGGHSLIGFDSFLYGNQVPTVLYATATPAYAPTTLWFQQAPTFDLAYVGPGAPVPLPAVGPDSTFSAGTNLVRDPSTQQQYLVQIGYAVDPTHVPTQSKPLAVGSSVVRVFQAVIA